ncbi:hypothetical protein [Streptomyces albidoflavus]|uniref:hypothetical protein n=1 Tax=Streptomyces albidoflavus TaxID=1886 RepID=UPI00340E7A72
MTGIANKPDLTHGALAAVIGPVSLLGVALGFAAVPFVMILGLIGGAVATVYGAVGLAKGERARGRCLVGLTTGAVAFLVPTIALFSVMASV